MKNNLDLEVLYYNARGLANKQRLIEFELVLQKVRWDIVGLSEVRRKGNELICRKNGNYFYFHGETKGYKGVRFYIKESVWKRVKEIKKVNERICALKLEIGRKILMTIIQIYAPILDAEDKEIREFYMKLQETVEKEGEYYTVVMGGLEWDSGKMRGNSERGKIWVRSTK